MPTTIPPFSNVPAPNDDVKSAWAQQLTQYAVDHVNDGVDAHDASVISVVPVAPITATNVQQALEDMAGDIGTGVIPDGDKGDITVSSGVWTIDNDSVVTEKLINGAVTSLKIAPDAVNELHLADGAVTNAKIADGAVDIMKIALNSVTNPMLVGMSQYRIKGRVATGAGPVEDLTPAQVATALASGSGGGTANFLRADGTWATPPSSVGPRGYMGRGVSTSQIIISTTEMSIPGATVTWTADPTRYYKISAVAHHIQYGSSGMIEVYIANEFDTDLLLASGGGTADSIPLMMVQSGLTGTVIRKLRGRVTTGSATFHPGVTIVVEDIGAV